MIEIPQYIINWGLGILATVFGWWARQLWDAQKELAATVKALELKVAGEYPSNRDLELMKAEIFQVLQRIESKLDGKANRDEWSRRSLS